MEFWPSCGGWRLVSSLPLSMPQCCLTLLLSAPGKCEERRENGGKLGGCVGAAAGGDGGGWCIVASRKCSPREFCVCVSLCMEQNWGIESSPRKVSRK